MKIINLTDSPQKNKRFRVFTDDGKHYDFGLDTGSTYIDHGDKQKRLAYIARHLGNLSEKRLIGSLTPSPALFSMALLWGRYDNIEDNIKYLNQLLNVSVGGRFSMPSSGVKGVRPLTYKNKFNIKYGFSKDESHSLEEISEITGYNLDGLQTIYNKGEGAYYSNPQSVRPQVRSAEQWAMARVYASLDPSSKAYRIDKSHLKVDF